MLALIAFVFIAAQEPAKPAEPPKQVDTRPAEAEPAEPTKLAAVSPAPTPAPAPKPPTEAAAADSLLQRAIALESSGQNAEAARLLRQAVRSGKGEAPGQAAKRLGDMLQKGVPGVSRDYGEALRYYDIARANGVEVAVTKSR